MQCCSLVRCAIFSCLFFVIVVREGVPRIFLFEAGEGGEVVVRIILKGFSQKYSRTTF